jgi:lysophospholipase L1-like esterase
MARILCIGDSITWGAFDLELGGWVNRLRLYYDNEHRGEGGVYSLGVSGDKVSDVLKRFDVEVRARSRAEIKPIILAIGINDSPHDSHPEGTDLDAFGVQYRELVSKSRAVTDTVIIIGPTNIMSDHPDRHGYKNETIRPYEEIIKKIAADEKLPYIDVFGLIPESDLQLDGLHPEAGGHELIFQKVKEELNASR